MKKVSLILMLVILAASIIGTTYYIRIQNNSSEQQVSITDAFNSSGAKMVLNELYFFVRGDDGYKDLESLTEVCEEVYKAIEVDNYTKNSTSSDSLVKTDFLGTTKDGIKVTAMASIVGNKTGAGDKYITVNANETASGSALLLREKIEKVFTGRGLKPVVNSCITGTYEGNLQDSQLENICRKILNDSDARKIDSLRQENIISVSAFSPMIKDKLSVDGKEINLSLAIRYNKLENKTYLWVATPVVNSEY